MGPELVILIIVLLVVLFWRGPSTLPRLGEALGKAVKGVRDNMPSGSGEDSSDRDGSTGEAPSDEATGSGPKSAS